MTISHKSWTTKYSKKSKEQMKWSRKKYKEAEKNYGKKKGDDQ